MPLHIIEHVQQERQIPGQPVEFVYHDCADGAATHRSEQLLQRGALAAPPTDSFIGIHLCCRPAMCLTVGAAGALLSG